MTPNTNPPSEPGLQASGPDAASASRLLWRHQAATIAAMYLGYGMFMVLRMIPTVAGAAIVNDPSLGIDLEVWGEILSIGTCGAVAGKFICGYAADRLGGKRTFTLGLLGASVFVGLFGIASSEWMLQVTFFMALLAKSAGWPSMARIIVNWFQPRQYGRVWGILSTSSRVGTMAATFVLGSLLAWLSWRGMVWIAAGLGLLTAIAFGLLLKERPGTLPATATDPGSPETPEPTVAHPFDGLPLKQALPRILGSLQFCLIAASLMGLGILWDFLLIVPMYLQDSLELSVASASRAASAFPLGSLISVLVGGYVFDKLSRFATAWVMGLLLAIATGCLAAFYLMPRWELSHEALLWLSLGLLFVFGLCVSPCYYIPMSVFSIEFGGPHAGFLIALLDALSFIATAVFYFFGGALAKASWSQFLMVLGAISVWSLVTTWLFLLGESRRQRQ
ncbi:MAG: MFS transporter [Planctomycetales bacterium]